jgi:DNA-binding CsgD family transcriptional regulator
LPGPLRLAPSYPFAGRARELGALRALLPSAAGEERRVALVAAEPGSGKSRLVRELAHELDAEGVLVLYGACDSVVRTPYGPFAEALAHLVRHAPELELEDVLFGSGAELSRLMPDLSVATGEPPPLAAADPDTERHRLHGAVVDLLSAAGSRSPVLLVLEDVHWADMPTLLLVRHLVRSGAEARMLLVATFRDTDADVPAELSETLVELGRTEGVVRMRLGALDLDDVTEFVRKASGADPSNELAATITQLTGGNAFLVTELWRELVDSNGLARGATGLELVTEAGNLATPETVRAVVGHRVDRLEPAAAAALELAAVAGSEFTLETLRRASRLPDDDLLNAVDDATRHGLLVESPGLELVYRFSHELVRRSVSDRLSASRRAEAHLRVAEAIEGLPSRGDARAQLSALAYHYAQAASVGGRERAASTNALAAESAAASLAFDDASEHLRTVLELGVGEPRERARIHLQLGWASHRGGRATDAIASFQEAAQLARALGDSELLARAAIGFEEACWRPGIHDAGSIDLLVEATDAIGDRDDELRVRLLGGLARARDFVGEHEHAMEARAEAIASARERGDRATLGWVLAAAFWSRGTVSSEESVNAMLNEAYEIGVELDDLELQTESLAWLVPSFVALCDHAAARRELDRLFESARRMSQPFHLHVAEHYASALALCDGDLAEAEAAAERSREWSHLLTGRDASGTYGIQMFGIRREQGRLGELAPVVRLLASSGQRGAWRPGLVTVLAELGMEAEARRELERILAGGLAEASSTLWLASVVYLSDACGLLGDEELAAALYSELAPLAGANIQIGHLVACYGSADRCLGVLASTLGEWERAEGHFEAALALNRTLRARTWVAHTAYAYGRMLLRRGRPADAAPHLGEALSLATVIGLPSLRERIATLDRTIEPVSATPDGLTGRELEILRLVARGCSNREIGAELHISEHTAANHIRSILRKTECANRTEAAAYAHRRSLVSV